jgi:hypothetical protein
VRRLVWRAPRLTSVCLGGCSVTDAGVEAVLAGCPCLLLLDVCNCDLLTVATLAAVRRHVLPPRGRRQLHFLAVRGCRSLGRGTPAEPELEALAAELPVCNIMH